IVFLELIIDPACSIAFEAEPEEANLMDRPPRDHNAPLFSSRDMMLSLLQGSAVLLTVLSVFGISLYRGFGEASARALTFSTLILGVLSLIFVNRSWSRGIFITLRAPNHAFWWVVGGALGFLAAVLYLPPLQNAFGFVPLLAQDWATCIGAAVVSFLLIESLRLRR
ncbi:MAG TPA: cation-translocating P-type ATPase C-terminal domain-containing protein, partial [Candidatus Binatus sp.]|nr:cation-translocating P-type ATPase C-terminal domain-containing protein [Candidatus Binatus sp.]